MSKEIFQDKVILAGTAGFLGILADEFIEWLAFLLKLCDSMTIHFIGNIIFSSYFLSSTQLIISELAHLIAGFILGIIPLYFYRWSGQKYPLFKGAGIGAGMWLNHAVLIPSFVDPRIHLIQTTSALIVELIGIILWGIVSYLFIVKYAKTGQLTSRTFSK
jgi:predicted neutral ceramidase superfamily lipid hydrolase